MAKKTEKKVSDKELYQIELQEFLESTEYLNSIERVELSFNSIEREGKEKLLQFLKEVAYYVSPASTRFHNNNFGGLFKHCKDVFQRFNDLCENDYPTFPRDSRIICGYLHDLCKVGDYIPSFTQKGVRSKTAWKTVNEFPIGHGEKSVIMLQQIGFELTANEMLIIRWHMGAYDYSWKGYESKVTKITPVVKLFSACDMISSVIGGDLGED